MPPYRCILILDTHGLSGAGAVIFALNHLGIGTELIQTLWTAIVAALALAFGLGGKEHASRALDKVSDVISHRN